MEYSLDIQLPNRMINALNPMPDMFLKNCCHASRATGSSVISNPAPNAAIISGVNFARKALDIPKIAKIANRIKKR